MSLAEDILKDVRMVLDHPCPDLDGTIIALQKTILRPIFPELEPAVKRLRSIIRDPAFLDEDFDKAIHNIIAHAKATHLEGPAPPPAEEVLGRIDKFLNELYNDKLPPLDGERVMILNQFKDYVQTLVQPAQKPVEVERLLTDFILFLRWVQQFENTSAVRNQINEKIEEYKKALKPLLVETVSGKELARIVLSYGVDTQWDTKTPLPFADMVGSHVTGWGIACALFDHKQDQFQVSVQPLHKSGQKYLLDDNRIEIRIPDVGRWELYLVR